MSAHHSDKSPRPGPAVDYDRAARCLDAARDIAEDCAIVADELSHKMCMVSSVSVADQLARFTELARLAEEGISALVVAQRSEGKPLAVLAPVLGRTEDRVRKKYPPGKVDTALSQRRRPERALMAAQPPEEATVAKKTLNRLRTPIQRQACALSRMQAEAGVQQRTLAAKMHVDPSLVSRYLSGERQASWGQAKTVADICGRDAHLIKPLWDTATGVLPPAEHAAEALRAYLRALRYADGAPSQESILASTHHSITSAELAQAFHGPGTPAWTVVRHVTMALFGLTDTAHQLCRLTRHTGRPSGLSAEAFG
ncbi:helix-turn-helix transcriptional regulator [Streptomyces albidoflavus]|uniref:helix-turn-helix domain-containing protein n=1 Tax=Streptomyces albidoflavus TaxID=1886 RepID=UPI002253FDEA|nr:helix-turn-helix transcriptional regulator [Streptomyces albidoflavus]MCX4468524.1 helix-turn-helix transcriptional regulator [Streptomyces albidoflavus]